jgi:endonuclease YncB( thermonuclease family)
VQKKIFYKILIFLLFFFYQKGFALVFEGIPRVIDGDSLEINNNKIRLFGIDAPEKKQICKKPYLIISFLNFQRDYKCGLMATNQLKKFIDNRMIKCISEIKDRYNRYLSICFLEKKDINSWLVKNGYAVAYKRYSKKYILEEQHAKKNKLGIWRGTFQNPEEWRKKN